MDRVSILRLIDHIKARIKLLTYKLVYGKKFQIGKGVTFRRGLYVLARGTVKIGDNVFFNNGCSVCALTRIEIGKNTVFGENVKIYDHNHRYSNLNIPIQQQGYTGRPIKIGEDCWIASNVVILKGVTIGDHVVIGAGCVIYKDVPDNTVVVNKQELQYKAMAEGD